MTTTAIQYAKVLSVQEMQRLIDELFACENPYTAPTGIKTFLKYSLQDLDKEFEK